MKRIVAQLMLVMGIIVWCQGGRTFWFPDATDVVDYYLDYKIGGGATQFAVVKGRKKDEKVIAVFFPENTVGFRRSDIPPKGVYEEIDADGSDKNQEN